MPAGQCEHQNGIAASCWWLGRGHLEQGWQGGNQGAQASLVYYCAASSAGAHLCCGIHMGCKLHIVAAKWLQGLVNMVGNE